jgi:hypothetical protein
MGPYVSVLARLPSCFRLAQRYRAVVVPMVLITLATSRPARGDVFHLANGGTVEGQLLGIEAGNYRIRTVVGIVAVSSGAVQSVEVATTPFDEYDRRLKDAADTPEAQTALAAWCEEQGLKSERRKHLLRALELDGDFGPARRALGYVRVGELWVDGRRVIDRRGEVDTAKDEEAQQRKLARAIQLQWQRRIRALKSGLLENTIPRQVEDGRARLLEIRDPLAIHPLTEVLTTGDAACRLLLVQALSAFSEDQATMNLGILALLDPEVEVRLAAIAELVRRHDPRIAREYRAALQHGNDVLLRRAALALGQLEDRDAVPDLIDALTAERDKWVEVPLRRYIGGWPLVFDGMTVVEISSGVRALHRPEIVGWPDRYLVWDNELEDRWAYRRVTVYRTEVLHALRQITGQDFGFDREAWSRWLGER